MPEAVVNAVKREDEACECYGFIDGVEVERFDLLSDGIYLWVLWSCHGFLSPSAWMAHPPLACPP